MAGGDGTNEWVHLSNCQKVRFPRLYWLFFNTSFFFLNAACIYQSHLNHKYSYILMIRRQLKKASFLKNCLLADLFVKRGKEELRVQQVIEVGPVLAAAGLESGAGLKHREPRRAKLAERLRRHHPDQLGAAARGSSESFGLIKKAPSA